jgi:hypothetical protein
VPAVVFRKVRRDSRELCVRLMVTSLDGQE